VQLERKKISSGLFGLAVILLFWGGAWLGLQWLLGG
jgi:hypothetical protein